MSSISQLAAVIILPRLTESISYRPYLEQIGSVPFLEWFILQFTASHPDCLLYIVRPEELEEQLSGIATPHGVRTLRQHAGSPLHNYARIAQAAATETLAFLELGSAFAPKDLLHRVYKHHHVLNNNFTVVSGFPDGTTPVLYQSELLKTLATLGLPDVTDSPHEIIERLQVTARGVGEELPFTVRTTPFDAVRAYHPQPGDLPEHISLKSSTDVAIAREVCCAVPWDRPQHPLDAFRAWRRAATEKLTGAYHFPTKRHGIAQRPNQVVLNVMYVCGSSAFAGGSESLCELVRCLDRARFRPVAVLPYSGRFTERLQDLEVQLYCPEKNITRPSVENFLFFSNLFQQLRPDLIHFDSWVGMPALLAAKIAGAPIVQHLRVAQLGNHREQLYAADRIIAVSEFVRAQALRLNIPESRVHIVYNGINLQAFDPEQFSKLATRHRFGIPPEQRVGLMIARFEPNKRHDLALRATQIVRAQFPSFHLVIVGEVFNNPVYYDSILSQMQEADLTDCVSILGFQRDIRCIQAAADVLILPSESEAFPRCVLEAMALGLPVIVAASGGNVELVRENETGFLFSPGDAPALAALIVEVLQKKPFLQHVISNARKYVEKNLSAEICARKVMDFYEQTVKGSQGLHMGGLKGTAV